MCVSERKRESEGDRLIYARCQNVDNFVCAHEKQQNGFFCERSSAKLAVTNLVSRESLQTRHDAALHFY